MSTNNPSSVRSDIDRPYASPLGLGCIWGSSTTNMSLVTELASCQSLKRQNQSLTQSSAVKKWSAEHCSASWTDLTAGWGGGLMHQGRTLMNRPPSNQIKPNQTAKIVAAIVRECGLTSFNTF